MPNFISDRLKKETQVEPKKPLFEKYVVNTDIKSIFCKYCNEAFYTDRACEMHISLAHDGDIDREKRKRAKTKEEAEKMDVEEEEDLVNSFKCDEYPCKRKFPTWHGLKIHLKSSHKYTTADFALNCDTCGRKFSTKTSLENHIENAHYLKCEECDEKFQENHQLEAHIRRRHNKKVNKCDQCGREFRSADTLRLHMEIHKKPEFDCMKCKRQFMTKGELDFHLMEHETDDKMKKLKEEAEAAEASKKLFCDNPKCNKSFLTEKSFKMHMDMHAAEEDVRKECPKCHKTFMTEKSLNFHIENFHPDVDLDQVELDKSKGVNSYEQEYKKDGWKCDECHRFFDSKQIYEYHMTRHANTFKCKECPEKFKTRVTKQGLEMHMQEHQKKAVELHMCKVCSKEFDSAAMLRFHETTAHESQHDFECTKCGKMLSSESGLEMHMETHEFLESMEIKCQECGKKFSTERNLELHIETYHREEVIIKCLYCDRQFDSDATIGIHMKHNHPEEYKQMQRMKQQENVNSAPVRERFKCPYEDCDATFRSENTLNLHVNNAHGFEDMEEFSVRMNAMTQNRIQETLDDLDIDMPKTHASRREPDPEPEPEPRRFKCEECGSIYSSERTYEQHMEYIHPKDEKIPEPQWKCAECGKTFRIEAGYNLHMSNHKQEKEQASLQCEHCEMSFDSDRQLSRHQRACVAKDQKDAREEAQKIRSRYETTRKPEVEPEPVQRKSRYSIPEDSPEPIRKTPSSQVSNLDDDDDDYRPASPQFECNLCKEQMLKNVEKQKFLSEMMQKYHDCPEKNDEPDEFKCDKCGKTYWSEKMLKIHSRTHISFDDTDEIDEGILNMKIEMPAVKKQIRNAVDKLQTIAFKYLHS
ncbi:unnamed protein product [Oikopleura dioica]|uniref:C2H2-type domain-containing protein n=1 Tax=Oikopleura dioica TaxID=34765 RepID=E4WZ56_OIKDI|nr:unnamed protein product [Oikopleura dioica]